MSDYKWKIKDYNFYLMTTRVKKNCLKNTVLNKVVQRISQKKGRNTDKEFKIDRKNIKKFVEKWEKGMTTNEISQEMQKENLSMRIGKKKRYNLKK